MAVPNVGARLQKPRRNRPLISQGRMFTLHTIVRNAAVVKAGTAE
jgi:hypothetical protein